MSAMGRTPPARSRTSTSPPTPRVPIVQVIPSPIRNSEDYEYVEDSEKVYKVLREDEHDGILEYTVMFWDTHTETVSEMRESFPIASRGANVIARCFLLHQSHRKICYVTLPSTAFCRQLTQRRFPSNNSWIWTTDRPRLNPSNRA